MSNIIEQITRLENAKANLKTSLEAKGVTVSADATLDAYPALVDSIPQGGGGVEEKDVNFYDYDGTCLYSYTKDEFLALSEMPVLPDHSDEKLISEEWNFTLLEAKEHTSIAGFCYIGLCVRPDDCDIRIKVNITYVDSTNPFSLYLGVSNGTGTIDWGDGTTTTITSTYDDYEHIYELGKYTISIKANNENQYLVLYNNNSNRQLIYTDMYNWKRYNALAVEEIYLGRYTLLNTSNNYLSIGLLPNTTKIITFGSSIEYIPTDIDTTNKVVIIPKNVIKIFRANIQSSSIISLPYKSIDIIQLFSNPGCNSFKINILKSYGNRIFYSGVFDKVYINSEIVNKLVSNGIIKNIILLNNVTTINSLDTPIASKITLPSSIISIAADAFSYSIIRIIYLLAPTPPTLGGSLGSAFALDKLYVPAESVEAYKAATNWSAYADKIFPIPTE